MKKSNYTAFIAVVFAMLFWSFTYIWYKQVFEFYNPITTVLFRLLISSALLLLFMVPLKKINKVQKSDLKFFALVALFNPFLYFLGESYGVKNVSSTLSAVIIATIPLFTAIVSSLHLKEKFSKMNFAGILLSIIGIVFIIFEKNTGLSVSIFGISMLFLAVFSAVGYGIVIKKLSEKYNSITIVTYHNFIGIFLFLPLFFILDFSEFMEFGFKAEATIPLLELAIFGSTFAFIFFTYAVQKIGVGKASAFTNAIPVFTAIIAYYIIDELISISNIAGIFLVIGGLFLSQVKVKKSFANIKS